MQAKTPLCCRFVKTDQNGIGSIPPAFLIISDEINAKAFVYLENKV